MDKSIIESVCPFLFSLKPTSRLYLGATVSQDSPTWLEQAGIVADGVYYGLYLAFKSLNIEIFYRTNNLYRYTVTTRKSNGLCSAFARLIQRLRWPYLIVALDWWHELPKFPHTAAHEKKCRWQWQTQFGTRIGNALRNFFLRSRVIFLPF